MENSCKPSTDHVFILAAWLNEFSFLHYVFLPIHLIVCDFQDEITRSIVWSSTEARCCMYIPISQRTHRIFSTREFSFLLKKIWYACLTRTSERGSWWNFKKYQIKKEWCTTEREWRNECRNSIRGRAHSSFEWVSECRELIYLVFEFVWFIQQKRDILDKLLLYIFVYGTSSALAVTMNGIKHLQFQL